MKKKILAFLFALTIPIILGIVFPFPVSADCGDVKTALIDCPTASGGTPRYLAIDIINILSVGIGIVGVIGISIFGIQILTSRDDPTRINIARKRFIQILIGIAIYLFMWTGANWLLPGGVIFGRIPTESIKISPSVANIALGKTSKLIGAIYPLDADDQTIIWESSKESVATVDKFGNVTGLSIGNTTIKATASNGSVAEATVYVVAEADLPSYCTPAGGTDGSTITSSDINTTTASSQSDNTPYTSNLEIHFVSTGNDDDAILIRAGDKVVVIDGGRCNDGKTCSSGLKFVNYMKAAGVTKIDALIGSHAHWNHIQAHSVIVENFETSATYYPVDLNNCVSKKLCNTTDIQYVLPALKKKKITPNFIDISSKPQTLNIGDLRFFIIGPSVLRKGNHGSFVFIMQYGEKKFMFTGDQEWDRLSEINNNKNAPLDKLKANASALNTTLKVDLFKWPHHGYDDKDFKDEDEEAFFKEIKASYIVVPNSNSCGEEQVQYATDAFKLKKYSNCGNTNLVITSDGKTIKFYENQSPDKWVPQKTISKFNNVTQATPTPQSCVSPSQNDNGSQTATSVDNAKWNNGNECTDEVIFPGKQYPLSESAIRYFANLVKREDSYTEISSKAIATQIINLYEKRERDSNGRTGYYSGWAYYSKDLEDWVTHDCWYSANCRNSSGDRVGPSGYSRINPNDVTEMTINAVREVIVEGKRTMPAFVTSFDCWRYNLSGCVKTMEVYKGGPTLELTTENISKLVPNQSTVEDAIFWCTPRVENSFIYSTIFKYSEEYRKELGM